MGGWVGGGFGGPEGSILGSILVILTNSKKGLFPSPKISDLVRVFSPFFMIFSVSLMFWPCEFFDLFFLHKNRVFQRFVRPFCHYIHEFF